MKITSRRFSSFVVNRRTNHFGFAAQTSGLLPTTTRRARIYYYKCNIVTIRNNDLTTVAVHIVYSVEIL